MPAATSQPLTGIESSACTVFPDRMLNGADCANADGPIIATAAAVAADTPATRVLSFTWCPLGDEIRYSPGSRFYSRSVASLITQSNYGRRPGYRPGSHRVRNVPNQRTDAPGPPVVAALTLRPIGGSSCRDTSFLRTRAARPGRPD